jgi:hypothetical protein
MARCFPAAGSGEIAIGATRADRDLDCEKFIKEIK